MPGASDRNSDSREGGAGRPGDPLERFVVAQEGVHDRALAEVRSGRKTGHWMWFVYPQLRGLGRSEVSRYYGVASLDEARAYLAHPALGPRLRDAARDALEAPAGLSAEVVFGPIDAVKLRSSMTLFQRADPEATIFGAVLDRFYGGEADPATLELLAGA